MNARLRSARPLLKSATVLALAASMAALAPLSPAPVSAQVVDTTMVHPEARSAIDRLWSPYCPGLMLEVCPSPGGAMLRASIDSMARAGLSGDSIVELVVAEYGEAYRAEPKREGISGLAWYVPPAALVIGLAIVAGVLARRRGRRGPPTVGSPPSEEDARRLSSAMAALDAEEAPDF